MTDFKVGDKVEVTGNCDAGRVGTITKHRTATGTIWPWEVTYDGGTDWGIFSTGELELVKSETKFQVGDWVKVHGRTDKWDGTVGTVQKIKHGEPSFGDLYTVHKNDVGDEKKQHFSENVLHFFERQLEAAEAPKQDFAKLYSYAEFDAKRSAKVLGQFGNGKTEAVEHPAHYGGGDNPYEAIKVIEAWGLGFNLGNAAKYLARAGKKGDKVEDLKKLVQYVQFEISKEEAK